jgi:hypothetical protein
MVEIGELHIKKLSGPVNLTYLFPKKDVFSEKADQGIFLPIIVLLGDNHDSEENRCEPCDEKDGCFLVESDTFLRSLDQLAKEYPVDVYTEYFPGKPVSVQGVLFNKFIGKTQGCYEASLRGTRQYRCSFPNVRWHYADTRFWKNKRESEVGSVSRYLKDLIDPSFDLGEVMRLRNTPILFKKFFLSMMECNRNNDTMDALSQEWSGILKDTISRNKDSVVYKQLKKYNLDISIDYYCYFSLKFHGVVSEKKVKDELNAGSKLRRIYNYIFEGEPIYDREDYKTLLSKISDLWVTYTACLLDMYFLGRMFKTPKDNINSYITVGFFGHHHSHSITNCLVRNKRWYDIKYASDDKDRCVRVNDSVDINAYLEEYSKWRILHQNIKPYLDRLEKERVD